jgi:transposase InsO family protein
MKYIFISDNRGRYKVGRMCNVLKVSRSGYYAWRKRPESKRSRENRKLADQIKLIHMDKYKKAYGSPRIHQELKEKGVPCSQNRVARVMKKEGIRAIVPRKYRATTNSNHKFPVAPNLLKQDFNVKEPNKVLVADITYIATSEGWLYLASVMDLGSRRIKGWAMSDRITQELTLNALNMAITNNPDTKNIIHHSDRGSQYACNEYRKQLKKNGLICSMSRKGNCWDNAPMESFFHTLKTEWAYRFKYKTRKEAKASLFGYIEIFYNRQRRHSALQYMNPCQYEVFKMAA